MGDASGHVQLITLRDWQGHYERGGQPRGTLQALMHRLAAAPAGTWIHLATDAELQSQIDRLENAVETAGSIEAVQEKMPFFGVPFVVKDNIDIEAVPTTVACPAFARIAPSSAKVVQRLLDSGAVWVGKTNLDQFATGLVGTRSPYGRVSSTLQEERVSGGSSAGSAVAVSLGLVPFALGTDTAGSGRIPAAFNNIVGLKPTPGRVSTTGVVPACRSLDCVSVFALVASDAAAVLAILEGADSTDAWSAFTPRPLNTSSQLRIGVPADAVLVDEYRPLWEQTLTALHRLGHHCTPIDFKPLHDVAALLYQGPWVAERHLVVEKLLQTQPAAINPVVRTVIEQAARFSAADTFRALYTLQEARQSLNLLWNDLDVLLVPSAPEHPLFSTVDADPVGSNTRLGAYTNFVNLLGWCAVALPAALGPGDLPFGATLIGPGGSDATLCLIATGWQTDFPLPLGATSRRLTRDDHRQAGPSAGLGPRAAPSLDIAVVGAHLSGMPLNHQLTTAGAQLVSTTATSPNYRLHALARSQPPRPGLERVMRAGTSIALEVWRMPEASVGRFLAGIPHPLGLGTVELADGSWVKGFICEPSGLAEATDISSFGGWRAWRAHMEQQKQD